MCGAYHGRDGACGLAAAAGHPGRHGRGPALVGVLVELAVIRHLYDRPLDAIVATWGLSLIATQGTLIMVGSTMAGIGTPFGSFQVGDYSYSIYRIVCSAPRSVWWPGSTRVNWIRFGVLARATIQVPHMARRARGRHPPDLQPHLRLRGGASRRPCRWSLCADHDARRRPWARPSSWRHSSPW